LTDFGPQSPHCHHRRHHQPLSALRRYSFEFSAPPHEDCAPIRCCSDQNRPLLVPGNFRRHALRNVRANQIADPKCGGGRGRASLARLARPRALPCWMHCPTHLGVMLFACRADHRRSLTAGPRVSPLGWRRE